MLSEIPEGNLEEYKEPLKRWLEKDRFDGMNSNGESISLRESVINLLYDKFE